MTAELPLWAPQGWGKGRDGVGQASGPQGHPACGGRALCTKNDSAISLAIVTALIEIQTASKCERFTNLHICLGCDLNYFPFPLCMPTGSRGGSTGAPQAGSGGGGRARGERGKGVRGHRRRPGPGCRHFTKCTAERHPENHLSSGWQLSHERSFLFSRLCPFCVPPPPTPSPASAHLCLSLSLPARLSPRAGPSVSLLAVVVIVCGVALVAVFLFLFWKLCWMPWRSKEASSPASANPPPEAPQSPGSRGTMADKLKDTNTLGFLEAAVKISHTSPDIPAEVQMSVKEHVMRHTRLQRQTTEPASSTR